MSKESAFKVQMTDELRQLFGEPLVYIASITDPITLDLSKALMDKVHDAADHLINLRGMDAERVRYISAMPFTERLVLCMWLMDHSMISKVVRAIFIKEE